MAQFKHRFNTHLNLNDFEKDYIKDFKDDERYDNIQKYLEDLLIHYTEYSKFVVDVNEVEKDNSPEELEKFINSIKVNEILFKLYLEDVHWTSEEFNILKSLSRDEQELMVLRKNEAVFYTFWHMNMEEIINYIESELFRLNLFKKPIQNADSESYKIRSKITNIQAIGYLFTEMVEKGLIEPKKKNGKISPVNIARMILEHFHFEDLEEQPNEEDLRKALFNDNKLSNDKISLFKLPTVKQLNQ